jgi:TonB family protein
MRNAPHRLTSALAWLALAKLLVPVALVGPLINRVVAPLVGQTGGISKASEWLYPGVLVGSARAPSTPEGMWTLVAITSVWAAGACWFVVRPWMRRPTVLVRTSNSAESLPDDARKRLEIALRATELTLADVRIVAGPVVPYVFGIRRRRLVLPLEALTQLPMEELRGIVLHEQAHLRRRDPLREVVLGLAMAAFYFYPPLWLISKWLRESAEYACDEAAVQGGIRPDVFSRAVARTLSLQVAAVCGPTVPALRRSSSLQARFRRLDEPWRYTTMTRHRIVLVIAVVSTILVSVAVAMFARTAPAGPKAQPATASVPATASGPTPGTLIPDLATPPEMLPDSYVAPKYPERAREAGIEGRVMVEALVKADGTVSKAQVVEGIADYPEIGASAVAAVSQWKFKPSTQDGKAVDVWVKIPVAYALSSEKKATPH